MSELGGRLIAYLVAGAIAAFLLIYGFGRLDAALGAKDAATTAASIQLLAAHAPLKRFRDSLGRVETSGIRNYQRLAGVASDLRRELDSVAGDTLDSTTPVDWKALALGYRRVADTAAAATKACSIVVLTCRQRAANAEAEAARLTKQLDAQTKVRDHPCGVDVTFSVLVGKVFTFAGQSGAGGGYGLTAGVGCRVLRIPFF